MPITHINPPTLALNPAFSQGTIIDSGRTLYVGGQNGTTADGTMLEGAEEQTKQALRNVLAVLDAAGAAQTDVAKLTIYLAESVDPLVGFRASQEVWTAVSAVSVLRVTPARPGALVEVEAIASLPPVR